jgi:hypothetical protein
LDEFATRGLRARVTSLVHKIEGIAVLKLVLRSVTAIAFSASVFSATPAAALVTSASTWVSNAGNDSNTSNQCARDTPCKTFSAAITATSAGGILSCLDATFNFGPLTISQSMIIDCSATGAEVFADLSAAFVVSGSGISVTLRGLNIYSAQGFNGTFGVDFTAGAVLQIENCKISGFDGASGAGIKFEPSNAGARLIVTHTSISKNGNGSSGGGIVIKPTGSGSAQVALESVTVANNVFGVFADGTAGGTIRGVVSDSVVSGNALNGISVTTNGANVGLLVDNTKVSSNNFGLAAGGTNGLILVRRSAITANNNGLAAGGGGSLVSYRDNTLNNNSVDGAFSFALGTQ